MQAWGQTGLPNLQPSQILSTKHSLNLGQVNMENDFTFGLNTSLSFSPSSIACPGKEMKACEEQVYLELYGIC